MEPERFPTFFGNQRESGMEIGSFEVGSKTFIGKRFARNGAFRGMKWQCAEWVPNNLFNIIFNLYTFIMKFKG
jgi:hypothetical protein